MSNTTLPELEAMARSFGVDVSAAGAKSTHGSPTDEFVEIVRRVATLSPRNRYLLIRSLWVMFDLDQEHAAARAKRRG